MKTHDTTFSTKKKQPCRSQLSYSSSSWRLSLGQSVTHAARKLYSEIAHVSRGTLATLLAAMVAVVRASHNYWVYYGLLLLALSPCAEIAYKLFNQFEGNSYWNTYFFLYAIGPHLSSIVTLTGLFLIFSTSKVKFSLAIPASYQFGKIIWLSQVSDNVGFHHIVPWSFLVLGFSFALFWFMAFDWLMTLNYHKKDGTIARIVGIIEAPGLDDHSKIEIAHREIIKLKSL